VTTPVLLFCERDGICAVEIQRGDVVRALRGRDKDSLLAVVAADENGILLCDGKKRPLERPKKKNLCHIASTDYRLPEQDLLHNRPLRRALNRLQAQGNRQIREETE